MTKIEIYSTAVCPSCVQAKQLLARKGMTYEEYAVDQDQALFEQMMIRANGRRTVPQIFINNEHIGGFDDLWALEKAGQLDAKLQAK